MESGMLLLHFYRQNRQHLLQNSPLLSLYKIFATLPDPRSTHGLRSELAYLLTCLVAGLLCNSEIALPYKTRE
jgi:hypothetical protein